MPLSMALPLICIDLFLFLRLENKYLMDIWPGVFLFVWLVGFFWYPHYLACVFWFTKTMLCLVGSL